MVSLAIKVVVVLVVVIVSAIALLRIRKLRRDEMRELSRPVERRLMTPPPSPYAPSKGFRLLDGPLDPTRRPEPARPRLETDRDYVFSEAQMPTYDDVRPTPLRHNEDWALSRSAHRSALSSSVPRVAVVAIVVVALVAFIGYYAQRGSSKSKTPVTTVTTTTSPSTTTSTTWPASFSATSITGQTATYNVPSRHYRVVVTGSLGPTYARYEMGPASTLEWQGTIAKGASESLPMTGNSLITLGAPHGATVSVNGSPVLFPSPSPATLNLSFVSSPPPG